MAGYVLGSLKTLEYQDLLSHIRSCVSCFLLTEEHTEVGAKLAGSIPEAEAPPSLRIRTQATIAHRRIHRVKPVVRIHYRLCSGLSWPRISSSTQRRPWRWAGK